MSRLPVQVNPQQCESASGYLLRALAINGSTIKEATSYCRAARRAQPLASDAELWANLTGASVEWMTHRVPRLYARDQWQEVDLFAHRWREPWLLRGAHQQVCPACLDEHGFARLEWDLLAYPVCHIHEVTLQDACHACSRAISPARPALDVCDCGAFLTRTSPARGVVDLCVLQWVQWLSKQLLLNEEAPRTLISGAVPPQLRGTSPDGAFRLVFAFGGGAKVYRQSRILGQRAWLGSDQVEQLLARGLKALGAASAGQYAGLSGSTSYALAEQAVAGVTTLDRAAAAGEMRNLRLGRRWSNAVPRCPLQQELFEELM